MGTSRSFAVGVAKNSVVATPPVPKLASRVPLALNRAISHSEPAVGDRPAPAQMILPSGCRASVVVVAVLVALATFGVVAKPPAPNEASSFPVGSRRSRPCPSLTTMSPLVCWTAPPMDVNGPRTEVTSVVVLPLVPKVVSTLPGVAAWAPVALAATIPPTASSPDSRTPSTKCGARRDVMGRSVRACATESTNGLLPP